MDSILNETGAYFSKYMLTTAIQGTIFMLIIGALTYFFRKKSATFQYTLWTLALCRFLIPPEIPLFSGIGSRIQATVGQFYLDPVQIFPAGNAQQGDLTWQAQIFLVWAILIGIFGVLFIWKNIQFFYSLKKATPLRREISPELKNALNNFGRDLRIFTIPTIAIPFTAGILRPKIYLPINAETWSANEFKFILYHELAHIRRGDLIWMKLQALLQFVFFFHPAVWIINYMLNYYRELSCDDISIAQSNGRAIEYSKILLNNLRRVKQFQFAYLLTGNFGKSKFLLTKRFNHILNQKEGVMLKLTGFQKILIIGLAILAIAISCAEEPTSSVTEKQMQTELAKPSDAISVAYDVAPALVGGFQALHKNLKYPEIAKKAGIEGTVIVKAVVDAQGKVIQTEIIKSLSKECDEAAGEAVKKTPWEPAQKDGKPVKVAISIPIQFSLK